jgi:ribosomal-protein-alanine N-acetyltransferase
MASRLQLEPLADRHVEALAALWFKDRDDLRRVNPSRHDGPLTLELAHEDLHRAVAGERGQVHLYAIVRDGRVAGDVSISGIVRWPLQRANVGFYVDSALRGQGIGTAALGLACAIGFEELGLHRLEAGAHPTNIASQTAIRHNGFTEIGLAQAYLFVDGAWQDQLLFQKLAPSP